MAYPTTLDSYTNPSPSDRLGDSVGGLTHSGFHGSNNDAIEALEAKVGVNSSAVTTSHDYKLSGVATGDKAASLTGTETLTNKTLTSPTINGGTITGNVTFTGVTSADFDDSTFKIKDNSDPTKVLQFQASSISTATTRTKTVQDGNGTLYETGGTDVAVADGGTGASTATAGFNALAPTTTKGDLITRDGSNNIRVAVGSDNQILIADSAQTGGIKWAAAGAVSAGKVDVNTTEVTITNGNTTTETTLFTTTVNSGTLSTNNAIRGKVFISGMGLATGGDTLTFRIKFGGSTLITMTATQPPNNFSGYDGVLEFYIAGDGATNVQKVYSNFIGLNPVDDANNDFFEENGGATVQIDKFLMTKFGTGAVDTTSNQTLAVTAQYSATSGSNDLVAEFWVVEAIR